MIEAPPEIQDPPAFRRGDRVQAIRMVRNDGTYPGAARGDVLVQHGEIGYVHSVGTFLNRFYVFGVDFVERGVLVGMRTHELEPLEN